MNYLLNFLTESIRYGFPLIAVTLLLFRQRPSWLRVPYSALLTANNRLALLRSGIQLSTILYWLAISWYSQKAYEQYAVSNRLTGPYRLFFWLPVAVDVVTVALLLQTRYRRHFRGTLMVAALWAVAYLAFAFLPGTSGPAPGWQLAMPRSWLTRTEELAFYLLLLVIASRNTFKEGNNVAA